MALHVVSKVRSSSSRNQSKSVGAGLVSTNSRRRNSPRLSFVRRGRDLQPDRLRLLRDDDDRTLLTDMQGHIRHCFSAIRFGFGQVPPAVCCGACG